MRTIIFIGYLVLHNFFCFAQKQTEKIMFYNVENLFDTYDNPDKRDEDFTYKGWKRWTYPRYISKQKHLSDVIYNLSDGIWPLVIGFAEVENRRVLEDLLNKTILNEANYGIVHHESPDKRGIDVAMFYDKDKLQLLEDRAINVDFEKNVTIKTRDILYAKTLYQSDTLHFFVCHFPSMIGGEKQSEWMRIKAAKVLRAEIDVLFSRDEDASIIISGDFNGKANTDAQKTLGTYSFDKKLVKSRLYNTGYYLLRKNIGTYKYKGIWQTIDHIIVSTSLLMGDKPLKFEKRTKIYNADFLLEEDKTSYGKKPLPSYRGPIYCDGYSDHLPIYIETRN